MSITANFEMNWESCSWAVNMGSPTQRALKILATQGQLCTPYRRLLPSPVLDHINFYTLYKVGFAD